MVGLIHYNPTLKHQHDHALAFELAGFQATAKPTGDADVHVISGPHFAYRHWVGKPRVLMIDRAWWGDPECVSIGWLQPDGSRVYARGKEPRPHPTPQPWKTREQCALVLTDYGQDVSAIVSAAKARFHYVRVRRHPADECQQMPLQSHLALSDVAIGTSGSALFEAVVTGVPSICLDPRNVCAPMCADSLDAELIRPDRAGWLHEMSYRQFRLNEIPQAWELLWKFCPDR